MGGQVWCWLSFCSRAKKAFLHPVLYVSGSGCASTSRGDLTLIPFSAIFFLPIYFSTYVINNLQLSYKLMLLHHVIVLSSVVLRLPSSGCPRVSWRRRACGLLYYPAVLKGCQEGWMWSFKGASSQWTISCSKILLRTSRTLQPLSLKRSSLPHWALAFLSLSSTGVPTIQYTLEREPVPPLIKLLCPLCMSLHCPLQTAVKTELKGCCLGIGTD